MNNDNLPLYTAFLAVVRAGSILEASRQLYISQPAISKAVHKLETNLGTTLFIRSSRGIQLTESGYILYENIKNAFEYIEAGENGVTSHNSPQTGHIRIGASTTLCKYILLPYLGKYTTSHPQINISIECQSSNDTITMLRDNAIDIGLIAGTPGLSDFTCHTLGNIHDIFAASPGYIDNLGSHNPLANLILLNRMNATRQFVDSHIPAEFLAGKNILEVDNMNLLIDFAKAGIGIGCIIKEFIRDELTSGSLVEYKKGLLKLPRREVCFVICKGAPVSVPVRDFLDFISSNRANPELNILI